MILIRIVRIVIILLVGLWLFWPRQGNPTTPDEIASSSGQIKYLNGNDFQLKEVANDLFVPWSLVFTDENRMLISERNGYIRQVINEKLSTDPLFYFSEVADEGEGGLMGLALHPEYLANKYVYAMLAYWQNGDIWVKVERLIDQGQELVRDKVIIDKIAGAFNHDGGRINFGPDNKLYVATGDASKRNLAQDLTAREGKILRLNDDGSIPFDNPFPNSPVYSYGHRNSQGFDWHPISGHLYATEHGPSGFDGPEGGDEINYIQAGKNYGWPQVSHDRSAEGLISPLITYTPAIAPSGAKFYKGDLFPEVKNHLFVAALRGSGVYEIVLDDGVEPKILGSQKVPGIAVGRVRDIIMGPDGKIYLLTSNRDGRGDVNPNDDKIYVLQP